MLKNNFKFDGDEIDFLRSCLINRQNENPSYSLRAFARDLGMSSGRLSEYLNRKRNISEKKFFQLVSLIEPNLYKRNIILKKLEGINHKQTIDNDVFDTISEWHYFALLNLTYTDDFQSDVKWLSKRLGMKEYAIRDALEKLERLGLIKFEGNEFVRTHRKIQTTDGVTSKALRFSHINVLEKACQNIKKLSPEKKDVTSVTMAINTKNIEKAKELTRKYKKEMEKLLEQGSKDEVYELTVVLSPLTEL